MNTFSFCVLTFKNFSTQFNKMLLTKCTLFAVAALAAINGATAIMGGDDADRGQFPYFVYIEGYNSPKISVVLHMFEDKNKNLMHPRRPSSQT